MESLRQIAYTLVQKGLEVVDKNHQKENIWFEGQNISKKPLDKVRHILGTKSQGYSNKYPRIIHENGKHYRLNIQKATITLTSYGSKVYEKIDQLVSWFRDEMGISFSGSQGIHISNISPVEFRNLSLGNNEFQESSYFFIRVLYYSKVDMKETQDYIETIQFKSNGKVKIEDKIKNIIGVNE